jgi:hypothetical protein
MRTIWGWGTGRRRVSMAVRGVLFVLAGMLWAGRVEAQGFLSVITEGITKVIRAVDLEVQRIQTKTIVLQEAQKEAENAMSALRLGEIRDWVKQQKDLYGEYFHELGEVKNVLSAYHQVSGMIQRQEQILGAYERGLALFRQDRHFSAAELDQITAVFAGILTQSANNLALLTKVLQSFSLQATDQERMAMIDDAAAAMDRNYRDIQVYTNENELMSLQRAYDENDYLTLKNLYGL